VFLLPLDLILLKLTEPNVKKVFLMLNSELLPLEELVAVLAVCQLLLDLVQLMLQDH
jgi:hypothetical protein